MPWFKVDDHLWSHPKFAALTDAAQALWLRAGCYASEKLTDGRLPDTILRSVLAGKPRTIRELVDAGLWDAVDGGVQFHDWSEYQPSAADVKRSREQARERMANVRANRRRSSHNPDPDPVPQIDDGDTHKHLAEGNARDPEDDLIESGLTDLGVTSASAQVRVLHAIRRILPSASDAEIVDVARGILTTEPGVLRDVRSPASYVETTCRDTPEQLRGIWERAPKPPTMTGVSPALAELLTDRGVVL